MYTRENIYKKRHVLTVTSCTVNPPPHGKFSPNNLTNSVSKHQGKS